MTQGEAEALGVDAEAGDAPEAAGRTDEPAEVDPRAAADNPETACIRPMGINDRFCT